jgi:outer membrane protein OmpA-like peptidoglycan-associated protein
VPQTAQVPPANQNAVDQNKESLPPLESERHEGFWGKINPLARKKYVQRQVEPIRNRVNELDELTAANSKAIRDVDSRAQEGIRMAANRADQANQHAFDAASRAQMADQTAQQANTRVQAVQQAVTNIDQYQPVTETEILLRPGQVELSKKAKEALDQMAESVKGQNAYLFEVQGFSSGKGVQAIENSQRIAESVVRYMVLAHDIPVYRVYLLGLGNAPQPAADTGKSHRTLGGRVEITLLKNPHLAELASASAIRMPDTPASTSNVPANQQQSSSQPR